MASKLYGLWIPVGALLLVAGFSSACSLSFAADVTPPPALLTPAPRVSPESTSTRSFPIVLPNPQNGQNIYLDRCAACHGMDGMGDGAQSGQLSNPAAALGNFEISRQAKPVEWFEIVTEGNLESSMPGFESVLSDRQRWDVVAFLYTLSYSQERQVEGAAIYSAECQVCHGLGGGDGKQAAELGLNQPDWLNPSRLVGFSADELMAVIAHGSESGMPAFADKLTPEQIQSVTGTIQTLGFTNQDSQEIAIATPRETAENPQAGNQTGLPNPTATPADQEAEEYRFIIQGSVTNGSGGVQPDSGVVTLQGFDGMESVISHDNRTAERWKLPL